MDPILVWRFHEAPNELQALSGHGGDEDWLLVFPPGFDPSSTIWGDPDGEVFFDWCTAELI